MPDRSFLAWPFFEQRHRVLAERIEAWAAQISPIDHADTDAACRDARAPHGSAGLFALRGARSGAARRRSLALPHARNPRPPCRARGLRVRHAGPRHRRDHLVRQRGAARRYPAGGPRRARARRIRAVRAGRRIGCGRDDHHGARRDAGWLLDGEKTWISNGGIAAHYVVFARTAGAEGTRGISAFAVPADAAGLTIAERIETIAPHPLATLRFDRCRLPARRLARAARARVSGSPCSMLDIFRATVGAAALGLARRALDEAVSTRAIAKTVRPPLADLAVPGRARRHGHRDRRGRPAGLSRRLGEGYGGGTGHPRGVDGQAVRDRGGAARVDRAVQLRAALGVDHGNRSRRCIARCARCASTRAPSEVQRWSSPAQVLQEAA